MKEKTKTIIEIILGVFGCCLAIFTFLFGDNLYQQITGRSIFQNSPSPIIEAPTEVEEISASDFPVEITDAKGVTMRLIPAGEFTMGSENGNKDEQPIHRVYLDDFYMDIYEVTNALYKACVDADGCTVPKDNSSRLNPIYYGNSKFDDYPVVFVDWYQAQAYCTWRGANLPTEAQWEKAARGTDGRTYPWGEGINCSKANYSNCVSETTKVGSYTGVLSPYGIYDLTGNVFEWVEDWYAWSYYENSPSSNPLGPSYGENRVLRGGRHYDDGDLVRSANRSYRAPDYNYFDTGFRCAKNVNPEV
jgi:formylglycine-generating enzyme required for sulfatase activity